MTPLTRPALAAELRDAPVWRLGFRPFFLLGAGFAALAMMLWAAALTGWAIPPLMPTGGWLAWHRHEMVFGFVMAIVAGFLLTAVPNWTGIATPRGRRLMALAALWLLARIAWLAGADARVVTIAQLAFMLGLAGVIARNVWRARQRRNYPVVAILILLGACDALALSGLLRGDPALQTRGAMAALLLLMSLTGLIAARVVPMFTRNGLRIGPLRTARPWLIHALLAAGIVSGLVAACQGSQPIEGAGSWFAAALYAGLGAGHWWQLSGWYHRGIWRMPLLWPLHAAYAWIGVFAFGMAAWQLGWLARPDAALHALTVGGLGGMTLAMMARVSLGHTGRPLQAPRAMGAAFALLNLGAWLRVLAIDAWWPLPVTLAALCWIATFLIFVANYASMLWRARVDGQPG